MSSLGAIRAGAAFVELSIRDKTGQGLRAAQSRLAAFAAGVRTFATGFAALTGVAAAVVAPVAIAARTFANTGSELHDMSLRTGVAADNLSELKFAAEQTGSSLADVEKALRFMAKQGIDVKQFDKVLKAVSEIADESERAAAAQKIFGRGGTALLAMAKELPQLRREAKLLGADMSPARADAADDLGDAFGRLWAASKGLVIAVGSTASALTPFINALAFATGALNRLAFNSFLTRSLEVGAGAGAKGIDKAVGAATGFGLKNIWGKVWNAFGKGVGMPPAVNKRPPPPNLDELDDLLGVKAGKTSRGQFGGFRAEALGIGSGGGTEKKLAEIKGVLDKMLKGILDNVNATKEIDGPEFT